MSDKLKGFNLLGFDHLSVVLDALAHHAFEGQVDIDDLASSSMLPKAIYGKRKLKQAMHDLTQLEIVTFEDPMIGLQPTGLWDEDESGERRQKLRNALMDAGIDEDELPPADSLNDTLLHQPTVSLEDQTTNVEHEPDFSEATTQRSKPVSLVKNDLVDGAPPQPSGSEESDQFLAAEDTAPPSVSKRLVWGQKGGLPSRSRSQAEPPPIPEQTVQEFEEGQPQITSSSERPEEQPPPPAEPLRWGQSSALSGKKSLSTPTADTTETSTNSKWERGSNLPSKKRSSKVHSVPTAHPTSTEEDRPEAQTPVASNPPSSGSTWQRNPGLPTRKRDPNNSSLPMSPPPPRKPGMSSETGRRPSQSPMGRSGGRMNRPGLDMPTPASGGQSDMSDENIQEIIAHLLEDRDLGTVDVATAEAYAQAILDYVEKLKSAGLDTEPASGVRLSQLLSQLLTRLHGTATDEE